MCFNTQNYFNVIMNLSCLINTRHSKNNNRIRAHSYSLVKIFNKELAKHFFRPMDAQELQNPEKVSVIWIKNHNSTLNKTNNTKSSMNYMKPKDTIKLDIAERDKFETYLEEDVIPANALNKYLYYSGEQYGDQKRQATDFILRKKTR